MPWRLLLLAPILFLPACDDSGGEAETGDASTVDASTVDASAVDASAVDASAIDASTVDAAPPDAGQVSGSTWDVSQGLPSAACPAWTLVDSASPENPTLGDGKLTLSTDADAEFLYYAQEGAPLITTPEVLVIEARLRHVSGTSTSYHRTSTAIAFRIGEPMVMGELLIGNGGIGLLKNENQIGPDASILTTDAPHTYRIEAVIATGAVTVSVDGVTQLTGELFPATQGQVGVFFGDLTSVARGTSEWISVSHNAISPTACP